MLNPAINALLAPALALAIGLAAAPALADHRPNHPAKGGGGDDGGIAPDTGGTAGWYPWMSGDVADAWKGTHDTQGIGYDGAGIDITVVDNFSGSGLSRIVGNLGDGRQRLFHGEWTLKEAGMVAKGANMIPFQYGATRTPTIQQSDVFNLSYGLIGDPYTETLGGVMAAFANEGELIRFADQGLAVVVHAAGNSNVAYGDVFRDAFNVEKVDFLALGLIGKSTSSAFSGLFVGALDKNGSNADRAALASYSNNAGSNAAVQARFLVVGVRDDLTGLAGTSFAAPIVSGYSAILSDKFGTGNPRLLTNRLLETAIRQDDNGNRTLVDLGSPGWDGADSAEYGRGEASLRRALAANSLQ